MKLELKQGTVTVEMSDTLLHRAKRAYDEELMSGMDVIGKETQFAKPTIYAARDALILGLILRVEIDLKGEKQEIKADAEWLGMLDEEDLEKLSNHAKPLLVASQKRAKK